MSQPERYPAAMPLTPAYITLSFCAGRRAGTEVLISASAVCQRRNPQRKPLTPERRRISGTVRVHEQRKPTLTSPLPTGPRKRSVYPPGHTLSMV